MPFSQDFRWLKKRDHELYEKADKLMWRIWGYTFPTTRKKQEFYRSLNRLLDQRNRLSREILAYENRIRAEGRMNEHPSNKDHGKIVEFRRRHTKLSQDTRDLERKLSALK